MSVDRSINQRSYLYFILFFLLMVIAFWKTYFTRISDQENYRMHLHGAALILWCSMLIAQPYLIRKRKHDWHRLVGKFSYVLVPILLFTTYDLLKYRMSTQPQVDPISVALVLNALIAFVVFYGLAIVNRKNAALHSRWMVCTIFPFITPVTDRILHIYFPALTAKFPLLAGTPNVPLFGFVSADIILIGLSIWDWKTHRRLIFPIALVVLLIYHYSFNYFYQFKFWQNFCEWLF
jgi:hypothetical protein